MDRVAKFGVQRRGNVYPTRLRATNVMWPNARPETHGSFLPGQFKGNRPRPAFKEEQKGRRRRLIAARGMTAYTLSSFP
jgi:hypothetical protein